MLSYSPACRIHGPPVVSCLEGAATRRQARPVIYERVADALLSIGTALPHVHTANLRTKILDLRGFDSSTFLNLGGGIPRPTGNFPESLSQQILVGIILVGRLGVLSVAFLCARAASFATTWRCPG